jgi:hypothetical protein
MRTRADLEARGLEAINRVAPHAYTSKEDIDRFLDAVCCLAPNTLAQCKLTLRHVESEAALPPRDRPPLQYRTPNNGQENVQQVAGAWAIKLIAAERLARDIRIAGRNPSGSVASAPARQRRRP